jgi:GT2 family glycosyltransferase
MSLPNDKGVSVAARLSAPGVLLARSFRALAKFARTARVSGPKVAIEKAVARIALKSRITTQVVASSVRASRLARGVARTCEITRSEGPLAAVLRAARKVQRKLGFPSPDAAGSVSRELRPSFTPPLKVDPYEAWRRMNRDNPRRRRRIADALKPPGPEPRFSVIVPVYAPPIDALRAMVASVKNQTLVDWELILVDDASPDPRVRRELERWVLGDKRIRVISREKNGNISVATNQAAAAATGEFLVLLDHDDLLDPDALALVALELDAHPESDLIYTDDDKIEGDGRHHSPQFKPGWSPELLLSYCYTGHLTAIRTDLYREVGGMRVGFEGSQDHDFWLRASERARRVGHVPQVLYHWRVLPGSTALSGHCKPASFEAGRRAVEEAFRRRGVPCHVEQAEWAARAGCAIFEPHMPDDGPSVAVIIPTRNQVGVLECLIKSLAKTTYRNYRVYVIDNESDDPSSLAYLASLSHRVLRVGNPNGRFNFAAINNQAARIVHEDLLLFLNNDTEVINPRWLSQMAGWSRLGGVGAVGARLLYPDLSIQHAGIVHGFRERLAWPAFNRLARNDPGYLCLARVSRNCMAVTAACMLTPRKLFLELGGFDEGRFAVAYNDTDYGYRLTDAGYRSVYCAEAELFHHEGHSRGRCCDDPREPAAYRAAHGHRIDPYFSRHLDADVDTLRIKPTVVPIGASSGPISFLAVTHNLNWEGASRFEFDLTRRLRDAGTIDPVILSPIDGPLRSAYEEAGVMLCVEPALAGLPFEPKTYGAGIARLAELIQNGRYEVVHANTLQCFWAVEAARLAATPSVWSVHESEPWRSYFDGFPPEISARALASLAYPYRVVFTARTSAAVWNELDSTGNFELIRFGLDFEPFRLALDRLDRDQARSELELRPDDRCVLLVGTVCARKGQHDLLHAYAALPRRVAERMTCIVVGGRESLEYSRELERLARELPEDRRDRFRVVPETSATLRYWRAADIFCCSSRIESYPRVILEAMAAGLPIITTPVFGIGEQVRESVNALFYGAGDVAALAERLIDLARNDGKRQSLAEHSPWVLRSLPNHADMDEQYERTFRAAAESASTWDRVAFEGEDGKEPHVRGPIWHVDAPGLPVPLPKNRQIGGASRHARRAARL